MVSRKDGEADGEGGEVGQVEDRAQGHLLRSSYSLFVRDPEDTAPQPTC
jgi:hypothetical protein